MSRRSLDQEIDIVGFICRIDFLSFIRKCFHTLSPNSEFLENWHIDNLAFELEPVRFGQKTRLIVNAPPRMMKSLICSIALPAYILGHDPSKRVVVVSYGTDLAIKLANDFRMVVNSAWYKNMFPEMRISRAKKHGTRGGDHAERLSAGSIDRRVSDRARRRYHHRRRPLKRGNRC